jgi:RHS repeat-associated protein
LSYTYPGGSAFYTFDPQGSELYDADSSGNTYYPSISDAYGVVPGSGTSITQNSVNYPLQAAYNLQSSSVPDTIDGLYVMGHRDYDPTTGRFLNRDPIGYAGGTNLYAYTDDNPVNWIDPDGTRIEPPTTRLGREYYDESVNYLEKSAEGKEIISELERSKNIYKIVPTTAFIDEDTDTFTQALT